MEDVCADKTFSVWSEDYTTDFHIFKDPWKTQTQSTNQVNKPGRIPFPPVSFWSNVGRGRRFVWSGNWMPGWRWLDECRSGRESEPPKTTQTILMQTIPLTWPAWNNEKEINPTMPLNVKSTKGRLNGGVGLDGYITRWCQDWHNYFPGDFLFPELNEFEPNGNELLFVLEECFHKPEGWLTLWEGWDD